MNSYGSYELLWTLLKCFWVAGDLTVLDWDLPAPRGFGVALRRWEAPRALVGVAGFEPLRALCRWGRPKMNTNHSRTHWCAVNPSGVFQSIIWHYRNGGKQRMFVWIHMSVYAMFIHCNAWLVRVKAILPLQLGTLQELLDPAGMAYEARGSPWMTSPRILTNFQLTKTISTIPSDSSGWAGCIQSSFQSVSNPKMRSIMSSWWLSPAPLKNRWVKVSGDDDIPNVWEHKRHVTVTTNQYIIPVLSTSHN